VREEAHFSWDAVEVGDDDRTLVLKSIHSPMVWSDDDAWFNGGRADVSYGEDALGVLLWLSECRRDDPGAARADDASREVPIALDEPVAGRVPYDGCYRLVEPKGPGQGRSKPCRWEKVQVAGPSTLVVYWHGGMGQLDRIAAEVADDAVFITVLEEWASRMAGRSKAALVHLEEPLGERRIRRGQAR
jgi:hypothetical protein